MRAPTWEDSLHVLYLQLADAGRGPVLLGEHAAQAASKVAPFLVGREFPDVYFEFPLVGDPFLDVTLLYSELDAGTRIASDAARGTEGMIDWFAGAASHIEHICCGFELDTSKPELPAAAVHFQPRERIDLVEPFCKAIGEPERAALYHELRRRMPNFWKPSFFGLFRGRPGSPLRVCGYVSEVECRRCVDDPAHLAQVLDQAGFTAYDDELLARVCKVMDAAPGTIDYQLDIYPDGSLGDTLGLDINFDIQRPELVQASFEEGPFNRVMGLLEGWGAADERWHKAAGATFARSIPVEKDDGSLEPYAFTLIPQWLKVRWHKGVQQPSKLYFIARAGYLKDEKNRKSARSA